jgi:hypothetical protein
MPTMVTSIENQRPNWPAVSSPVTLTGLPAYVNNLASTNPDTQLTGMTRTGEWRFSGTDQTGDERRPQGLAVKDGIIITQWKFISGANVDKQKLILIDPAQGKWRNIGLLEVGGGGLFNSFTAAVGGIGVSGNYLYLQSNFEPRSFRVFDLREFYELATNSSAVDAADTFAQTYPYFIPQIGEIFVTIPEGSGMGWFSIHDGYFIFGNFYDPENGFTLGGRSLVWKCPVIAQGGVEFPVPGNYVQSEPLFPAGPDVGTTVTRIQGGIISGNALILSRSWSTTTKQLMVLNLSDPAKYFVGTGADPQTHNDANWLRGGEAISAGLDDDSMVTVTEFQNYRNVTQWDLADVRGLVDASLTTTSSNGLKKAILLAPRFTGV